MPLSFTWAMTPLAETLEELVDDRPGAGVRRALHPGGGGRARRRRCSSGTGIEGRQGGPIAERIGALPVRRRLRQDPVQAGAQRHRRAPRRDAAALPPAGRAARPGRAAAPSSAAPTPSGSASTCRSGPCCSPGSRSSTATGSGCCGPGSSSRSPAARAGPASTRPGTSSSRRPSTSSTTSAPRRRRRPRTPRRAPKRQAQVQGPAARSRPRARSCGPSRPTTSWSPASPSRWSSRMRVDNAMLINVVAREEDAFAVMRRLLTDNHEDRAPAAAAGPAGAAAGPLAAAHRGADPARRGRRVRPPLRADRRPAGGLRAQPAAGALRAGGPRRARPGVRRPTPSTSSRWSRRCSRRRGRS